MVQCLLCFWRENEKIPLFWKAFFKQGGNHYKEPFLAKRNESFWITDEDKLTVLKRGYEGFDFVQTRTGSLVSFADQQF